MGQNPISAYAYAQSPSGSPKLLQCDSNGNIYVSQQAQGNSWFVNETTGDDDNAGTEAAPFATLDAGLAAAAANNNDTVYLIGTSHRTSTLAWNKNGVNLVGINTLSNNDRARISVTGATVFSPLVNMTGVGCRIINIATFHGFADASAQVCWAEAGGRNYYSHVDFLGMGNATAAAQAGSRSLTVASQENIFDDCVLGLDTVLRATNPNYTLEFLAGSARNTFNRPTFQMLTSLATDAHINVGAAAMDRYALFNDPVFINAVESTSIAINAAVVANAAAGGAILLNRPFSLGATALAVTGPVYLVGSTPVATTSGIAIKAT